MVAGCGNKCVKYVFFAFNFLIFLLGALILGLSLWIRFDNAFQTKMTDSIKTTSGTVLELDQMYLALYITAGVGGLLCLTGFLGCCGACCESVCLLGLFFTIVMVLFVAEIGGAIYIFVKKSALKSQMGEWYKMHLVDNYDKVPEVRNQLNQLQEAYFCCGATGCVDYKNRTFGPPESCKCDEDPTRIGCSDKFFDAIAGHIVIVAGIAIGVLAVELLAMIFSCILCSAIRSSAYDYY